MGFLLGILGVGKTIVKFVFGLLQALFVWALAHPWQTLVIILAGCCLWMVHVNHQYDVALTNSQKIVATQKAYIEDQTKVLGQYVTALNTERQTLANTIKANNKAVADLREAADRALANAQAEQAKAQKVVVRYQTLAQRYAVANPVAGTAEQRITTEQNTTDQFIRDFHGVR